MLAAPGRQCSYFHVVGCRCGCIGLDPCLSQLWPKTVEASVRFQTQCLILFESCDEAAHDRIPPL